jgi:hypothetical protein
MAASGMLSLVLPGVPLDVGVVFAVVVAVCSVVSRSGATDLGPGIMPAGAGDAETSAPSARRLAMPKR